MTDQPAYLQRISWNSRLNQYRTTCDWSEVRPSDVLPKIVAHVTDQRTAELPPVEATVEATHLDGLLSSEQWQTPKQAVSVSLAYANKTVVLSQTGLVIIRR